MGKERKKVLRERFIGSNKQRETKRKESERKTKKLKIESKCYIGRDRQN